MCTFTVVALSRAGGAGGAAALGPSARAGALWPDAVVHRGYRVAFNRDESCRRPAGRPPIERAFGLRRALLPVDAVSNGTWIAVNDAGLALALLNVYAPGPRLAPAIREVTEAPGARSAWGARDAPEASDEPARWRADDPAARPWPPPSGSGRPSRGAIIPALLHLVRVDEVSTVLRRLALRDYPPFRVVAVDSRGEIRDLYSDSHELRESAARLDDRPLMLTSSGLGDGLVDPPRRRLFEELVVSAVDPLAAQAAYHRHSWPDARHLSVCMARADARTVSHTTIDVTRATVAIEYWPDAPDQPAAPIRRTLLRGAGG